VLRIYGRTNSVNVQKAMWCIGELALSCERIDAGMQYGKNDEEWFLRLNPNGRVPLLQDGEFSLWESNSIVRYLCAKHDFGGLYPASPEARAHAERWMDWQLSTLIRPVSIVFVSLIRTPEAQRDPQAIAAAAAEAQTALALLDRHLAAQPFVAGPQFSMGDIPLGATVHRWLELPAVPRRPLPALEAWRARLAQRPAFRQHVMLPLS
jgi:glutathione S-transferase